MLKKWYSTVEVAKILRITRHAVAKRIKTGNLKAEKVGRNFAVSHSVLLEALGRDVGPKKKEEIEEAIDKAMKDYSETFRMLAKE